MPSNKRPVEDADDVQSNTLQSYAGGLEPHTSEPGSARKKQATASSRTGQACDRCKIRKIRCDARVGGCSPCLQNNTECRTTDRITGRATSRGHTEKIEGDNATLRMYVVELQQQLREKGVEPKPAPTGQAAYTAAQQYWPPVEEQSQPPLQPQAPWVHVNAADMAGDASSAEQNSSSNAALPDFRRGLIGDNYLGVSSGNSWLSPIEGTSLTLFGMKIDLSDFIPQETDPSQAAYSYQTFLKQAFGGQEQVHPPALPSFDLCKTYAAWYFRSVQGFLPILHKPDFMILLERIYNQNYSPNAAETVLVHMMLAIIMFQYSHRNNNAQTRQESIRHYHYSLSFVPQLIEGHQLQHIQALAMICQQLRSQPRVGAAWMFTNMVLGLAIELGLHRSAKAWPDQLADQDPQTVEMRKRIFWSILIVQTTIGGKLGRPMPRMEDFDIELPEPVNDNLPSEGNLPNWRKCSYRPATQLFKLTKVEIQAWSILYTVGTPAGQHEANVQFLEKEIQNFKSQLPLEYSLGPQTRDEDRITSLYIVLLENEIRLLMHHPSLPRPRSPQSVSNSYDICLDAASKILQTATQLVALNSLDTTWYYVADFLAAIFTTLFVYSERKEKITTSSFQQLTDDMKVWLDVMAEVGKIIGTGPRLAGAIKGIIDQSLNAIGLHIAARTASAAVAPNSGSSDSNEQKPPESHQQQHLQQQSYPDVEGYNNGYGRSGAGGSMHSHPSPYPIQQASSHPASQHGYSTGEQYTYPEPQESSMQHYAPAPVQRYQDAYNTQEDVKPAIDGQIATHSHQSLQQSQAPNYMAAYQSAPPSQTRFIGASMASEQSQPVAWRNFTDNMMMQMGGTQSYLQANPLMNINASPANKVTTGMDMQTFVASMNHGGMGALPLGDGQQTWPIMNYGTDVTSAGGQ